MCFGKAFHLILMHFYFLYSMLWDMFSKNQVIFLKRCFFPDFRLIQSNFRSIEILLKKFSEPLSGSIDRTCFSINRTSWIKFFKKLRFDLFIYFFKTFSNFPLSLRLGKAPLRIFCHFQPNFLQGFSLPRPVRPLYPFFCFIFMISCINSCILMGFSELFTFGIFVESILFFWN